LDSFDIKLLTALQENNQRTSEDLAALVSLSPSACLRRVKRLRDTGVISADVSVVAPGALGQQMTLIVVVALERDQQDLTDAFMASMRGTAQVTQCYYVTGQADFVLVISVRDMEDYESFTRAFFADNRNIKRHGLRL
jgi:Lrp/AsnC family leucine-responsive transcriptional regulator